MQVPTLETPRLKLRPHTSADLTACAAMWADPVITRFIGGKPATQMESWGKILRYAGLWPLLGYGYWAVEEKSSGLFIGELGFADFKREITPSIHGTPELGWALASPFHGKGYATEAIKAAIAWGDQNLKTQRSVCIISPQNLASIHVAGKIGFHEIQHTLYGGEPTILFERSNKRN